MWTRARRPRQLLLRGSTSCVHAVVSLTVLKGGSTPPLLHHHGIACTALLAVRRAEVRREAGAGYSFRDRYVQDERYFAIEHMDVRREVPRGPLMCLACPGRNNLPQRPFRIAETEQQTSRIYLLCQQTRQPYANKISNGIPQYPNHNPGSHQRPPPPRGRNRRRCNRSANTG
jgi:hypothetical protein